MRGGSCQLVKKVFLPSWWTGEQAIHNSQWSFRTFARFANARHCRRWPAGGFPYSA